MFARKSKAFEPVFVVQRASFTLLPCFTRGAGGGEKEGKGLVQYLHILHLLSLFFLCTHLRPTAKQKTIKQEEGATSMAKATASRAERPLK